MLERGGTPTCRVVASVTAMLLMLSMFSSPLLAAPVSVAPVASYALPPQLVGLWQAVSAMKTAGATKAAGELALQGAAGMGALGGTGASGALGGAMAAQDRSSIRAADRYVLFEQGVQDAPVDVAVILRLYDKWYDDRAAEPLSYKEAAPRTRNSATASEAEHITAQVVPIAPAAWEINARYGKRAEESTIIPVAVIGDDLYLDFVIQAGDSPFYQGVMSQKTISTCPMPSLMEHPRPQSREIASYYATSDAVYQLRYWPIELSAAEKSNSMASFFVNGKEYTVPAQIVSLGSVFTCVTGRSKKVRSSNILALNADYLNGKRSEDGKVIALGAPAMVRAGRGDGRGNNASGASSRQELLDIVSRDNQRRCPPPAPLLPPSSADWHMDTINLLEEGNEVIRSVRDRSREFTATEGRSARADVQKAAQDNSRFKTGWKAED